MDESHKIGELYSLIFTSHKEEPKLFFIYIHVPYFAVYIVHLSYDVASGSEITPCNKIDKPLVVYRFTGKVMTSIITLRT